MTDILSHVIHQDDIKHEQVRLTVSEFRGVEYLGVRKYYMSFDEEWCAGNEGVTIPLSLDNSRALFEGLIKVLALAESQELIMDYFGDMLKKVVDSTSKNQL